MNLFTFTVINITAESMCVLIILALIFSLFINSETKIKQGRVFLLYLVFLGIILICDIFSWAFDAVSGDMARNITVVTNFTAYILTGVTSFTYVYYIYISLSKQADIPRTYFYIAAVMGVIFSAAVIISQWSGMFYTIDENNVYALGPYYNAALFFQFIYMFLAGIFIISYRKILGTRNTAVLLSYVGAPLIATCIHFVNQDLMVIYIVLTLSSLVIYMNFQARESKRLKYEMKDSRSAILLSQIKPHFMFNTLGSIKELYTMDSKQADKAMQQFSQFLHINMDSLNRRESIPFRTELEYVELYLSLEKIRFEERLKIEYDLQTTDFSIPALSLQPIVENAVHHGIISKPGGGKLKISTAEDDEHINVVIHDDGVGFDPADTPFDGQTHVGVRNVKNRLANHDMGELHIKSAPEEGTTVTIKLKKKGLKK